MIRLLIKDYTLQEKRSLARLLVEAAYDAKDEGAPEIVTEDILKAYHRLKSQIDKEVNGNAQNR